MEEDFKPLKIKEDLLLDSTTKLGDVKELCSSVAGLLWPPPPPPSYPGDKSQVELSAVTSVDGAEASEAAKTEPAAASSKKYLAIAAVLDIKEVSEARSMTNNPGSDIPESQKMRVTWKNNFRWATTVQSAKCAMSAM